MMTKIAHSVHKMCCTMCFACIWSEIVGLDEGRKCSSKSGFWWNVSCTAGYIAQWTSRWQERPYHDDSTASRLLSEVKHRRAWLVLRWGTTLESQVLFFCFSCSFFATFHHTALITYSLHLPFSTVHHAEPIAMPFFSWKMLILLHLYWFLSYSNSHFNSPTLQLSNSQSLTDTILPS